MVEEDPSGLIREDEIFEHALAFVEVIERELIELLDEIEILLDKIKGGIRHIKRIHIQKPDDLTIEVVLI